MSKIEVDAIDKQSGSTLTLGGSGTAVTLACGATQTGFGRTGTVDWQTGSIKTGDFTAVNTQGFFVDTNGGAVTATLPAGSAGAIISFQDYRNTFDTHNLTITPDGSEKINTGAGPIILSTEGEGVTLVYIDSTVGWRSIQDNVFADVGSNFISATGGTITNTPTCRIHTFTGPGTFTVSSVAASAANNAVALMVVAGGGGGSGGYQSGGGGAGGFREFQTSPITPYTASPLVCSTGITVTAQGYPIVVGGGGPGATSDNTKGTNGVNSSALCKTSTGGGAGGAFSTPTVPATSAGNAGGSGGGAGRTCGPHTGGSGNSPSVSPAQGNNGGATGNPYGYPFSGGGGGGATAVGSVGSGTGNVGNGGAGATTSINATPTAFAGGGGGGGYSTPTPSSNPGDTGAGGTGGGGQGAVGLANASNGTANTGGGAGGSALPGYNGGNGGSGIVIIRYKNA
jgi:hypothetical protein